MDMNNLRVGVLVAENIEREIEIQLYRLERRQIRDRSNPFEIPDGIFKGLYRLPKQLAIDILQEIEPFLVEPVRITSVPTSLKVLCALHFFAHGNYQKSVGQDFNLGLSQTTVSRCIAAVSNVLSRLGSRYMTFPKTEHARLATKRRFMDRFNFPGVIGCIDCTHVAIVAPPLEDPQFPGYAYLNRKGYHSLNVQIICDADLRILNVNARYPGSTHDSAIWRMSAVFRHLQDENIRGTWLLGDSGYPLQPWLLTPIEGAAENTPEGRYTRAHVQTRNVVERCYGVLKNRFRCLLKHRVLHYGPSEAGKIINACCVLHNILVTNNIEMDEDVLLDNEVDNGMVANEAEAGDHHGEILAAGRRIQRQVVRHFENAP